MKNKTLELRFGKSIIFVLSILSGFLFNEIVFAAPGDLDPTFGTGGKVVATIPNTEAAQGAALQADGKIVLASTTISSDSYADFAVLRLNSDGTTDTSFGTNGKAAISFDNFANERAIAVAVQPNGKIVVVGNIQFGSPGWDFGVARLNSDGSLDTSFGSGGKVKIPVSNANDFASDLVLQSDGKIIIVGSGYNQPNSDAAIVRLNTDGTLDNTFNGNGKIVTPIGGGASNDDASAVILQSDGKIVIAGNDDNDFALLRFNPNGSFDSSFGSGGKVITPIGTQRDWAIAVALQPDGKIIAGGSANSGGFSQAALVRYNTDGSLDSTFGNGGKVTINARSSQSEIFVSVIIQADGKIITVGTGGDATFRGDFILLRFNSDGSLDTEFGSGGKVITTLGSSDSAAYTAVSQADGKIVAAGFGAAGSTYSFAVLRYLTDSSAARSSAFDYDGDGKSDIAVFRPSTGTWYLNQSTAGFSGVQFGISSDEATPADFDGDGKTDIAVFRPSNGAWYRLNSSNGSFSAVTFGTNGDFPVPDDFDGDGKADITVFRPSNGTWYCLNSSNGSFSAMQFGSSEDKPTIGDFDGDGKADIAVFRPSTGSWYRLDSSTGQFFAVQFGIAEDKPTPADFDGDGKTDISVFRPSNGAWYRLNSSDDSFAATAFGVAEDKPVAADYDGDGKADIAVFRPSTGSWYLLRSTAGFAAVRFGVSEDKPTPNAFVR